LSRPGKSVLFPCRASRGFACRFAEKVARDVDYRKPSPLFRMCLKICFDEDLHGFLACVHFDTDRRIAEIDLMAATVLPSDNRMRHVVATPLGTAAI
jgi:hypothetical protein